MGDDVSASIVWLENDLSHMALVRTESANNTTASHFFIDSSLSAWSGGVYEARPLPSRALFHACRNVADTWLCCRAEPRRIVAGNIARRRREVNVGRCHASLPRTQRLENSCHIVGLAAQWLASRGTSRGR